MRHSLSFKMSRKAQRIIPVVLIVMIAALGAHLLGGSHADSPGAPTSPPVTWCGDSNFPGDQDPYTSAPSGAVTVPAGNDSSYDNTNPNTTYWFTAGTHTNYSVLASDGDKFIGAPGAIIDGGNNINYAFQGEYNETADEDVSIEYLTIQHYNPNNGSGAINVSGNNGWTEEDDLMQDISPGAALMLGGDNLVNNNCMQSNGEYGAQGYSYTDETFEDTFTGGATNITFTNNDVYANNTQETQGGVEGGVKFWQNGNVVVTGNYVHGNIESPGLWMDTDNAGFLVKDNYISDNGGEGLMYEISYNADIIDNTFVDNGMFGGPGNPGFPTGAIYVSESGGYSNVASNYAGELNIQDNVFTDNWGGVVVYANAGRYPGNGEDPGTLTPPAGVGIGTWIGDNSTAGSGPTVCPGNLAETSPVDYHDLCTWVPQNVTVQNNTFAFNPSDSIYGGQCTEANSCGQNALFAAYSTVSAYPSYAYNNELSSQWNDSFKDNTYTGPWTFVSFTQGNNASWSQWSTNQTNVSYSGYNWTAQDVGSIYNESVTPPPSTPNNVTATANSPTSVTVNWSASSDTGGPGLGGYYILRNGTQVGSANSSTTSYTDNSASGGTSYSYTVEAYDTADPVDVSAASSAAPVTTPNVLPSTPTGLTTTSNTYDSVGLHWSASTDSGGPGIAGYYVIRNGVNITPSGITTTSYTDTTVSAATTYSYKVEAYDSASTPDISALSSADSVTTPSAPAATPPTAPTNLTATAASSSQINLSWTASTSSYGVTGYIVYSGSGTQLATVSTTSYGVTGLSASTGYSYYVKAYNSGGDSAASSTASATTQVQTGTTPPTVTLTTVPASNSYVHGNSTPVDITAMDHASSTVTSAQLLLNSTVIQMLTAAPYDFTLNTLGVRDGSYTLTTNAIDALGLNGSSSPLTVIVNNGDLNGDGKVNISDLAVMASHWGQTDSNYADGNVTGQSTINISDLSVLANNWNWTAP